MKSRVLFSFLLLLGGILIGTATFSSLWFSVSVDVYTPTHRTQTGSGYMGINKEMACPDAIPKGKSKCHPRSEVLERHSRIKYYNAIVLLLMVLSLLVILNMPMKFSPPRILAIAVAGMSAVVLAVGIYAVFSTLKEALARHERILIGPAFPLFVVGTVILCVVGAVMGYQFESPAPEQELEEE